MSEKKRALKCETSNKNAVKSLQDMPNFAASDRSSDPCLVLYPPPKTTKGPNSALLLICLAIIKWICINCLWVKFLAEQQNRSFQGHLLLEYSLSQSHPFSLAVTQMNLQALEKSIFFSDRKHGQKWYESCMVWGEREGSLRIHVVLRKDW